MRFHLISHGFTKKLPDAPFPYDTLNQSYLPYYSQTPFAQQSALQALLLQDAIYLTGGNESGFYRAPDSTAYFTEKAAMYHTDKHHGVAPPWLVLSKR